MTISTPEKRKNGPRRGFPWWTLVLMFALGVALALLIVRSGTPSTAVYSSPPDGLELTATAIIQEATLFAPTLAP